MCPTVWFYLAEIYRLQEENEWVTLSMLAEGMDVSLQAASRMIRQMAENGHVIHEPYRGVQLTPEGARIALHVIRRHRILEVYLVRMMDFGWDEVHDMVETLERATADRIIERMDELAGHPTRCPHGEPIPTPDGVMPDLNDRPLTEWEQDQPGRISRVKSHDPERLRYLAKHSLTPGRLVTVTGKSPFNGPIHVQCGAEYVVLGHELAREVYIEDA